MQFYTIFMQKIANKLESKGFKVIKIAPNHKHPQYKVYYFEDTVELRAALQEILTETKKKKERIKTYAVFTWRVANELNKRGFRPVGKRLDFKDPTKEVILFEDTAAIHEAVKEITENK